MKVSELEGAELDYWVGKSQGWEQGDGSWADHWILKRYAENDVFAYSFSFYQPSKKWEFGGQIIEREQIWLCPPIPGQFVQEGSWRALPSRGTTLVMRADTPLIAAMRCFVASKFGEEVGE